ncbi:glycoside hydrolase family 15 protein [Haematomicrobium sanguinis]|uniref:glycoside hydrolase family 15 protein n=1 Tax=Haematomicrobium sanguinis TaxID=479106 RepID=UPI00047E2E96|nr:glycoside hydrolase family 15 protein [Haematomicrobium sanguinis]
MPSRIEDYALLSDQRTAALVAKNGSVDWLCLPRFDSGSVFAALLGTEDDGRWLLRPADDNAHVTARRYRESTFIVETTWRTATGEAKVTEFMPVGDKKASIVRRIEGLSGTVTMTQEIEFRFNYGKELPWVRREKYPDGTALLAIAGPNAVVLRGDKIPKAVDHKHRQNFDVRQGEQVDLELTWFPSHRNVPPFIDVDEALKTTADYWRGWANSCSGTRVYPEAVERSLLVLRALTHEATGGIVAAPTTSLPESFGGERNWDYRYCWLRDAALTLEAMMLHGHAAEASEWRNWLLRAVAGDPDDLQIMYGVAGERELPEKTLDYLPGYENSRPVRIGNGAVDQYQADVVGEVMVALDKMRQIGVTEDHFSWPLQRALLWFAEKNFDRKDTGIWEMRGEEKYFTHSRVMMWAAFDRGVRAVREYGLEGPVERWEELRDRLRAEVMEHGWNAEINSFTQSYGSTEVDASLLVLPQVGFVEYDDDHMLGTVARLERDLLDSQGLILRYRTEAGLDGLEPGEHPFLVCCFWLVEQYARSGRVTDAQELMDRLLGYSSELGLLSEEYDAESNRMAGNYPQAFSHLGLVRAADALAQTGAR